MLVTDGSAKRSTVKDLLAKGCDSIAKELGAAPDLVVAFVSPNFVDEYKLVPQFINDRLQPGRFIGCSASGLIGGGKEVEMQPAIALTAAILPGVEIDTFHLVNAELPDLDDGPHKWEELIGVQAEESSPHFVLIPDPFSFNIDTLMQGLDFAFPAAAKIGGLASGASRPGMNALFMNDQVYRNGMVGASFRGNVVVETIVAQGCRPIGKPLRVSKCERNIVFELDGKPAVNTLHEIFQDLSEREQELVKQALFIGIAMDEFRDEHGPGDFLVRNIVGIEPTSGAIVIDEAVREEQTVQFHARDASTSADDLKALLKQYRDKNEDQARGALLFSCLGRGQSLYGVPNHDSDCFKQYMGEIPLGGFFCNGEIGPVGGTTFLHGYTSSFGLFRQKSPS